MRRRAASSHPQMESSLLGLAPGGGYLAARITADAGGLLHHLFTFALTPAPLSRNRERGWGEGRLFLWPLSGRLTPNEVSPPRALSDAEPCGVRTFLDPVNTGPRSPDQPEA